MPPPSDDRGDQVFHPRIQGDVLLASSSLRAAPGHFGRALPSIEGRRVMVTGAGGSIGSELVRQIARSGPSHLTLVELSEVNLYEIDMALGNAKARTRWVPCLSDIRDQEGMRHVFVRERPDIVFHAAALKHVPLLESSHNLIEAVRTNVLGTKIVCDLCASRGADFVMVSTDKAVKPSSTMGLTKRVAEIYVHEAALRHPEARIAQVRFGNVVGSSGSVVPLFRRQIAQGGPVTVTHPDMTRYLMTIEEAASLTLAAAGLPQSAYALYVLEMGEPVNILELAKHMIELAGLRPYLDIAIQIVGTRPGEKLSEELAYPWEELQPTAIDGVRVAYPAFNPHQRMQLIDALLTAAAARDGSKIRKALIRIVPEFEHHAVISRESLSRAQEALRACLPLPEPPLLLGGMHA
jgi:FlaA1/EpsC-like NDP-sugar epimerase